MSYRLVILGVLAEQPHYGYDLKQTIERQHYADYIRLSGGGLYYHLRKLKEEGYIEEQTVEREGKYPDRHIYRITERGRAYLIDLLRTTLDDVEGRREYDPLDAALSFAFLLPREEVLARLQHQLDLFESQYMTLMLTQQAHRQVVERTANLPSSASHQESQYAQLMIDHNVARLQQEVFWLKQAIASIKERHQEPAASLPPGEAAHARQRFADEYASFEDTQVRMNAALATYQQQIDLAWQEYQHQARSGAPASGRQAYQQRVAEAREQYSTSIHSIQNPS